MSSDSFWGKINCIMGFGSTAIPTAAGIAISMVSCIARVTCFLVWATVPFT